MDSVFDALRGVEKELVLIRKDAKLNMVLVVVALIIASASFIGLVQINDEARLLKSAVGTVDGLDKDRVEALKKELDAKDALIDGLVSRANVIEKVMHDNAVESDQRYLILLKAIKGQKKK